MITLERLKSVLHYDPETGLWTWLERAANNIVVGQIAGTIKEDGYIRIQGGLQGLLFK